VRTFHRTAPTVKEHLLNTNTAYEFSIFASTYTVREAAAIASRQSEKPQRQVTGPFVFSKYADAVPRQRFFYHEHDPHAVKLALPFKRPKGTFSTKAGAWRAYLKKVRVGSMFAVVAKAYVMLEQSGRRFDVVIRLRFDLELLGPFKLQPPGVAPDPCRAA